MCLCGFRHRFFSSQRPSEAPGHQGHESHQETTVRNPKQAKDFIQRHHPIDQDLRPRKKKYHVHHARREWQDGLLLTNAIYVLAALISYGCNQYFCAIFQFSAAIASTLFHRSRETRFLLVDAIVSSTLAFVWIYFAFHTIKMEWYGILSMKILQGAMCIFTWIYCGMPGDERYEKWHQRWHYVSGYSTISTSLLLATYIPEFDLILHEVIQDYILVTNWLMY